MKVLRLITTIFLVGSLSSPAFAIGFGDLVKGSKSDSSNSSAVDAVNMQDDLVKQYIVAALLINEAQRMLAEALGLNEDAARLKADGEVLGSGAVLSVDSLEKSTEISEQANKNIEEKLAEGAELSSESQLLFAQALIPYATGLYETSQLYDAFEEFGDAAKEQISAASMIQKIKVTKKLAVGLHVVSSVPGLAKDLYSTSEKLLSFAKSNNIDVPEDATDALGDLVF